MNRPPIDKGPELDFPEKHVVDLRHYGTRDLTLEMLAHNAKLRAERRPKEIAAIASAIVLLITALTTATVKVINALKDHSDRAGLVEYRLDQNEKRLDGHDARINNCCSR